ncbi:hypothetical protein DESAMIL20_1213 [Desulfurella amilsii]|uniref:Uncharacterized protein n=1 Tax=Desulfurella amilsii TaxID=1562698 RepID=A0A1X4XVV6_9BACT|nr:hypothetical protein DESAMIL20_1213 [Desulfurella amilsii]
MAIFEINPKRPYKRPETKAIKTPNTEPPGFIDGTKVKKAPIKAMMIAKIKVLFKGSFKNITARIIVKTGPK